MKKKILQIQFKGEALETIDKLKKKSGVKNRAEVVRDAVALYKEIDKLSIKGKVTLDFKKTQKILELPRRK